jgi:uncharacterized MAPEG superfamily protein
MTAELTALVWAALLGLVHVLAPAVARTRQYGMVWNAGPRDQAMPPPTPLAGRLARAQANYFESFPLFTAAVLIIYVADLETDTTLLAASVWLVVRAAYLPLYALGVPYVRGVAWLTSIAALLTLLLRPLLA